MMMQKTLFFVGFPGKDFMDYQFWYGEEELLPGNYQFWNGAGTVCVNVLAGVCHCMWVCMSVYVWLAVCQCV